MVEARRLLFEVALAVLFPARRAQSGRDGGMDALCGAACSGAREGDEIVFRARGDLDYAETPRFMDAIGQAFDGEAPSCVIDCTQVTFIDSETLKALLVFGRTLAQAGRALTLRNCSGPVRRIINVLGLQHLTAPGEAVSD